MVTFMQYIHAHIPVKKGFNFWADACSSRVELNAECDNRKNSRHLKQPLSDVERDVSGSKGDGYFYQCIVEDV